MRDVVTSRSGPGLRDELATLRMAAPDTDPDALVFGTTTGKRHTATNIRKRVLARAVERAEAVTPMPEHLTPHSLRRTFASLLYAIGEDPPTGDGGDGALLACARVEDLCAGDAPRPGREGAVAGACRGRLWTYGDSDADLYFRHD